MRSGLALAALGLAVPASVHADRASPPLVDDSATASAAATSLVAALAIGDVDQLRQALAPTVELHWVEFGTRACDREFGKKRRKVVRGKALARLATCMPTMVRQPYPEDEHEIVRAANGWNAVFDMPDAEYRFRFAPGAHGTALVAAITLTIHEGPEDELGGIEGGVLGGMIGRPPPPPPPPPPSSRNIPSKMLEGLRIAGDKVILPDENTKLAILDSGRERVIGAFKLCIDEAGRVSEVKAIRSTKVPSYDRTLLQAMRAWRYRPYRINGKALAVCTAVTFIYSPR